jgi:D-alanine--poly(phosphoribitol) ligase subunit 1
MQINVLEYLESGALINHPEKPAIVFNGESITFRHLHEQASALGTFLAKQTEDINQPIAVFLPKSIETVIADLAILYSGNFYTNLDEKSPPERLRRLLENINPCLIITSASSVDLLCEAGAERNQIVKIDEIEFSKLQNNESILIERRRAVIDTDPLCLINTSGSTGTPKSVILNHRSTIDFIDWCTDHFDFSSLDEFGSLSPLYFDIYTLELYISLSKGSTIHLIPEQTAAFPARLVDYLEEKKITFIFWVPTIMVNIANLGLLDSNSLQSLRRVFFAGEVFPTKHLNMWRKALPHATFVNLYGPIEITVDCTYYIFDREFNDDSPIPIGFPCRNSDVLIIDEHDKLIKDSRIGELCVRGSSLALGYYNNPEQTSKAFVQNPLNPNYPELIYRTGDLVHRNELGEIMFDGRKDFQIKHLGYRIELAEIENAVLAIDEIRNACVLYHREKKAITLVFEATDSLTVKSIRTVLQKRLPKYMLPTAFFEVSEMPRNPNGKIDRQQLAIQYTS